MVLKQKIIHESLRLFSLKGFLNTSVNDILKATGTSKGGLYNHFRSKEDIFYAVLSEARKIWRERNLYGLDQIEKPIGKVKKFIENYRDRYLTDSENFPGGCIFVTFAVELADQRPHLAREINEGLDRLKVMIKKLLDQAKKAEELRDDVNTEDVTEMIIATLIGACVLYSANKSKTNLHRTVNSLCERLESLGS